MGWIKTKLGDYLTVRKDRFKPSDERILGLRRIEKIDFAGNIYVSDKPSNTDMILVKKGDLVISGINVEKGAMNVYEGDEDLVATIHYSSYSFDRDKLNIDFLKHFLKSDKFKEVLKEQVPGGIKTEIKPKHILPLEVNFPETLLEQNDTVEQLDNYNIQINSIDSELQNQLAYVKQLRQAYLTEAMQGKLVSNDLPAGEETGQQLLEKIKAEKSQLIKDKKLKKEKPLAPIKPEEIPFEIPENWVWCRLGEIVMMSRGKFSIRPRNDPRYFGGEHPFIQIGSLDEYGSVINNSPQTLNELGCKVSKKFPKETIVIAIVGGTIGNLGILGREMYFTDSIVGVLPFELYVQKFILNYLKHKQPEIKSQGYQMAGQPNIKLPNLENLFIAFPPLCIQNKIVEKLDELMHHCDALEESIKASQTYNQQLLQQVLKEALEVKEEVIFDNGS
jgi:type I restriction enzyme S subunit